MQQQWTISWSDCGMQQKVDFIQQATTTSSVTGLRGSSKALPKAKFAPKKGHGHCSVVCCQSHPLQLSESQGNHYIWEVCSADGWNAPKTTPVASTGQQKGPNSSPQGLTAHLITNASKVEWTGLWSFASSTIFTRLLANWLPLLQAPQQLFAGKTLPQWARGRKCFPRTHRILKHGFLCYRNKPTYCWQKYVDCNGSYFDYQRCVWTCYNDLKFMVQNHSYFCNNLIVKIYTE